MSFGSKSLPDPTVRQKERWASIKLTGCIACRLHRPTANEYPEIHHLLSGGLRMGHDFTVGLCAWHHRGQSETFDPEATLGPSLAKTPKAFHAEYGADEELLKAQNELIDWTDPPERQRKRKSRCVRSTKTVPRDGRRL